MYGLPLIARGSCLGALIVVPTAELSEGVSANLEILAWGAAVQIDHPALAHRYAALSAESEKHLEAADEKNDELLKLSEELFAQDIELLRNNEKLGKIEKLKNDFIEKMSRELRTPLNSIIEATITVLSSEVETLSPHSQQTLRNALDEGVTFRPSIRETSNARPASNGRPVQSIVNKSTKGSRKNTPTSNCNGAVDAL